MASMSEELERAANIILDNEQDQDTTLLQVIVTDIAGVFRAVSLALQSEGIKTKQYYEEQGEGEEVIHTFRITDENDEKISQAKLEELNRLVARATSRTSSNLPAIYGMVAKQSFNIQEDDDEQEQSMDYIKEVELTAIQLVEACGFVVELEKQLVQARKDQDSGKIAKIRDRLGEARGIFRRKQAAMEGLWNKQAQDESAQPVQTEEQAMQQKFLQPKPSVGPAAGNGYEIILQGFNWDSCRSTEPWYNKLMERAEEISNDGFTAVWFPPSTDSVSEEGYLPRDLYQLNSKYGTQEQLHNAIEQFHNKNIKVIADIVINHRCAHYQGEDGKWNKFGGRLAWDKWAICKNNREYGGTGNHKTGDDYTAAPNLDHTNAQVQKDISEWLNYLRKTVGFDGWRFDFTKGYSGKYTKLYVDATVPEMAFGEFWDTCDYTDCVLNYNQDSHRQRTINWIDSTNGTCAAFDFTTKGILQEAVSRSEYWRLVDPQGRPPGLLGMWPSRAITFIENHDTGSTLQHWPFPKHGTGQGYAYIITHPGTPCIFYDHYREQKGGIGQQIKDLIKVRKRNGIWFKSKVKIVKASGDVYAAVIDDKVALKMGPGDWSPKTAKVDVGSKTWQMAASGHQFAVWEAV